MAACTRLLKSSFPALDDELFTYINGVLEGGADEFSTSEDVFDAVGAVLLEVADESKDEKDIMEVCDQLLNLLKSNSNNCYSGHQKILDAPIHLGRMAEALEPKSEEVKSIWLAQKEVASKVDQRKLEKVEARLKGKLEKRGQQGSQESNSNFITKMATATQAISRKESRMEAKGINNSKDIHIENFDVAFGDRVLIRGADITLVFGHRYGFVGRNGLGKTTLLRMISSGQLRIPSHFRILHVEQEVVGDDTPALQSVLECDTVREELLQEEKSIYKKISEGNTEDPNLNERLTQIYTELQAMEADKAPAKASVILAGLGFSPAMQEQLTKEFSGGWRMRLALARALFSKPDLLLLDEPTNMLDMKAIIWLESYLQTWPTTLLVVSHDRHFLDVVPTDILLLHSQRIDSYKGNYENFIKVMTEKLKNQQREYEAQQQYRAHVQVFIDKFRYNAKRASLVQSKIKMLEKLPELQPVEKEQGVVLRFPDTENLSPPILQLQDVSFHYVEGKPIFSNINVSANMESRICIVGDNGAGKSTLLKLLLGDLSPVKGIKHVHRNLRIGYFSQHHVDQLDMNTSSVELLASRYPGKTAEEYRHQLGSFGISGDLALQQVASLSGGQKSRVAFALMCMNRPNFLILDEPTNHLDVETIEALGKAINKFTGGIMLVSHDERLIRAVCKELWICAKEQVRAIDGGFDEYRKQVEEELENQTKSR